MGTRTADVQPAQAKPWGENPATVPKDLANEASDGRDEDRSSSKPDLTGPKSAHPESAAPSIIPDEPRTSKPEPAKSPLPPTTTRPKPDTPAKPQTDFRANLRSRAPAEAKSSDTPEFLNRFGNLRKTATEKYVAPDVFGDNIKRGKADLTKTSGPVKTVRRDELKESLLAKKEDWKKAKEEGRELPGQVHERKMSGPPVTPGKPEALARRELLGSAKPVVGSERAREATPEALSRHKSLKQKPKAEPEKEEAAPASQAKFEDLSKQKSAPGIIEHAPSPTPETSKLAARFNPGLAGLLARGPPAASAHSNEPSRSSSPALPAKSATFPPSGAVSEPKAEGPLQDMRKGRAKGPKKRKGGGGTNEATEDAPAVKAVEASSAPAPADDVVEVPAAVTPNKPRAPPGSAASVMMASLRQKAVPEAETDKPVVPAKSPAPEVQKPATPAKSFAPFSRPAAQSEDARPAVPPKSPAPEAQKPATPAKSPGLFSTATDPPKTASTANVPEFGGFGSAKKALPTPKLDDDKENSDSTLPSVKAAASFWGRQPSPTKQTKPQIQLPSRKDEEAAMRSAGLLASSPSRPSSSSNGLGISVTKANGSTNTPPTSAGLPPKPSKSSRVVSGQLQEASPNKGEFVFII
jgi:hypothetical protein